jgi:histidinol-phosphate aminotransferase
MPESITQPIWNILPRRLVQTLPGYGAPDEGRYGKMRLDFNENTEGLVSLIPAEIPKERVLAYPEYGSAIQALAEFYSLSVDNILLTNGSDEALAIIAQTFIEPGEETAIISKPTFAMIPHYLTLAGANLVEIPVLETLEFDLEGLASALKTGAKFLMLASPDNPTGSMISQEHLKTWCARFPETLFVLDEAYVEYAHSSALNLLSSCPNLLITRTFSKAWGMAGLRLGVVLGHPQLITWLAKVRSPYSVNALAVYFVEQALAKSQEVLAQAKSAMERKNRLLQSIHQLGFSTHAGEAHFLLLRAGIEAFDFCQFAEQHGVLIRNRSKAKWPEPNPSPASLWGTIRINTGTESENQKLLSVLQAFNAQTGILFDLDDTLVDTSKSFDATVFSLIQQYSSEPLKPGELTALRQQGGFNDDWDATVYLLNQRGVAVSRDEIAKVGTEIYLSLAPENETLLCQIDWFADLAKRSPLFVVTGRYRQEYDAVWAERLNPYFTQVICRDDYPSANPKPAPDLLNIAKKNHGIQRGYYIGNSVDDMQAAVLAGLIAIGVTQTQSAEALTKAGASYLVSNVNELKTAFQI